MKFCRGLVLLLTFCLSAVFPATGYPAPSKKRIAIFQSGEFWEFAMVEKAIKQSMERQGVMQFVDFPPELRLSPGENVSEAVQRQAARQLMEDPGVDVIISMGTRSTLLLLQVNNGRTPIIGLQISNPAVSGIIDKNTNNPVAPNLFIPNQQEHTMEVFRTFHAAIPFNKLGILHDGTPVGMAFSNVQDAREAARERGFDLVEYNELDAGESYESCKRGLDYLFSQGIDAFYMSPLNCFDLNKPSSAQLYKTLHSRSIRTFASNQGTMAEVQHGVLMGLVLYDTNDMVDWFINTISIAPDRTIQNRITTLPSRPEVNRSRIGLNLKTALDNNVPISLVLLVTADAIYDPTFPPLNPLKKLEKSGHTQSAP